MFNRIINILILLVPMITIIHIIRMENTRRQVIHDRIEDLDHIEKKSKSYWGNVFGFTLYLGLFSYQCYNIYDQLYPMYIQNFHQIFNFELLSELSEKIFEKDEYRIYRDIRRYTFNFNMMILPIIFEIAVGVVRLFKRFHEHFIYIDGLFIKSKKIPFSSIRHYRWKETKEGHEVQISYHGSGLYPFVRTMELKVTSIEKKRLNYYFQRKHIKEKESNNKKVS